MGYDILIAHRLTDRDTSPLQFVSAELLAHYRRCEAELARIQAQPARHDGTFVGTCSAGGGGQP